MNTEIENCKRGGYKNETYLSPYVELIPISAETAFADSRTDRLKGAENEDLIVEDFFE